MADRPLLLDIFRLNIVDDTSQFDFMGQPLRTDADILRILSAAALQAFDHLSEAGRFSFSWGLREFFQLVVEAELDSVVACVTLARSTRTQTGQTVTESRIEDSVSELSPPPADTARLIFYMRRHLVAVEYSSAVMGTELWRTSFNRIVDAAALELGFRSHLRLEPVPQPLEVLNAFRSFDRLTRLRVKLRIPNPELDRFTERLRKDMEHARIREYLQDMRNPGGLSQSEDALPFASAAMAQAGYKDGEIILSGFRNGKPLVRRTGKHAARVKLDGLKDYVRGLAGNSRTKETRSVLALVLNEIDRAVELPVPPSVDSDRS